MKNNVCHQESPFQVIRSWDRKGSHVGEKPCYAYYTCIYIPTINISGCHYVISLDLISEIDLFYLPNKRVSLLFIQTLTIHNIELNLVLLLTYYHNNQQNTFNNSRNIQPKSNDIDNIKKKVILCSTVRYCVRILQTCD